MADLRQRIKVEATLKDGVSRGLEGIRRSSERSLGDKGGGLAMHAGTAKLAMAGLAAGVVAVGVAIFRMTRDVSRHNDELAKMSLRIGASTEALSQYEFVAKRSGIEFRTLTMGWQRMTRRISEAAIGMGEARGALQELHLSAAELNKLAPEDQFEAIADAMQKVTGQADKVRLSMKLFDSEGVALVQTMANGAEGIRKLREEADSLGLTLTKEAAVAAEKFEDQITNLTAKTDALKKAFAEGLIKEIGNFEAAISGPDMKQSVADFGGLLGSLAVKAAALAALLGKIHAIGTMRTPAEMVAGFKAENAANAVVDETAGTGFGSFSPTAYTPTLLGITLDAAAPVKKTAPRKKGLGTAPTLRSIGMSPVTTGSIKAGEVEGKGFRLNFERGLNAKSGPGAAGPPNMLSMLAFGPSKSTQDVFERLSFQLGDDTALKSLQGFRTRTAKDGELDVVLPFSELATSAGDSFVNNLDTALTLGLADFVLEGDLKGATETFGATLAAGMVVDAAAGISKGITKRLKVAFKPGSTAREGLVDAGQDIGGALKGGMGLALEGLEMPASFAAKFGADGSIGKSVATGLTNAVVGGIMGAKVGELLGAEIHSEAAAIGGALGGAFKGPVGALVGSLIGALASRALGVGGLGAQIEKREGIAKDFALDVASFGGLKGYFQRLGGIGGLTGERGEAVKLGTSRDLIQRQLRLSFGASKGAATDVANLIRTVAVDPTRKRFELLDTQSTPLIIEALLRELGLEELIGRVTFSYGSNPTVDTIGGPTTGGDAGPRTDTRKPAPPGYRYTDDGGLELISGAPAEPVSSGPKRRLSVSEGRDARAGGYMSIWAENLGAPIGSPKGNNIKNLIDSAGQDQVARQYLAQFYDIVASRGYHGTVSRPTTILAGESGPERIDITPDAGYLGGASGGGGTVVHFNVNIQALDPRGVRDLMEGEVGDMLLERIRASSERGETVIYSTGVTTPPSV